MSFDRTLEEKSGTEFIGGPVDLSHREETTKTRSASKKA
jgi:hypothetical protein